MALGLHHPCLSVLADIKLVFVCICDILVVVVTVEQLKVLLTMFLALKFCKTKNQMIFDVLYF